MLLFRTHSSVKTAQRCLVGVALGVGLGITNARVMFAGSWLSLIPWAVGGLALGFWTLRQSAAAIVGATYGFALSVAFMIAGYTGSVSLVYRLPYFAILGLVGALCGLTLAVSGASMARLKHRIVPRA